MPTPKARHSHQNNRTQENMDNLSHIKHKRPRGNTSTLSFLEARILNWNNLSTKKKIGLIIVSAMTLYLAILLFRSFFASLSSENKGLLPKENILYRNFPEFVKGTSEHTEEVATEMDISMRSIDQALRECVKEYADKKLVIALGGAHDSDFYQKINVRAYLKQQQILHPQLNITFIIEVPADNEEDAKNTLRLLQESADLLNAERLGTLSSLVYKNMVHTYFQKMTQLVPDNRKQTLSTLSMVATHVYQFNQITSSGHPPLTSAQQKLIATDSEFLLLSNSADHTKLELFTDDALPHLILKQIDRSLALTIQDELSKFTGPGIVVVDMGAIHLLALANSLKKMNQPSALLHLQHPHQEFQDYIPLTQYCFMPILKCPKVIYEESVRNHRQGKIITYCGVPKTPSEAKDCDKYLEEKYAYYGNSSRFLQTMKHQIPQTLAKRNPSRITDFFATKQSLDNLATRTQTEFTPSPNRA